MEEHQRPPEGIPATYLTGLAQQAAAASTAAAGFAVPADAPAEVRALVAALNDILAETRQDAAALRAARAQAEAATQAKTAFLANMSHDLRAPLNSILGFTEMMADGHYGPVSDEQRNRLTRILANGRHLLGLLNEILDLTRIEAGRVELFVADFDLGPLLRSIAGSLEPAVQSKDLRLQVQIAAGLPRLHSDMDRVEQVVRNLLANALQHTDQGVITLAAGASARGPGWVRLAVRDTGRGIPAAALPRIWEEFFQGETGARRRPGAGLGLPISRRLVQLLGGEIGVESVEHRGACFWIELPARAPGS